MIKTYLLCLLFFVTLQVDAQTRTPLERFHKQTDLFLKRYVSPAGQVNYQAIVQRQGELELLIEDLRAIDPDTLTPQARKAFLINAYNLMVISTVCDHYPIRSPQNVRSFFDGFPFKVGHQELTLNQLEKKVLFPAFKDPRLHFVLVCGAKGCPVLSNEAYTPQKLEVQLDVQTRAALNSTSLIRMNDETKSLQLSELFKWYAADFKNESQASLADFINQYRSTPISKDYKISYFEYDWSLNDAKTQQEVEVPTIESLNVQSTAGGPPISNVRNFTPAVLLKTGAFQVDLFNNIYTQTEFRNELRDTVWINGRETFFTGLYSVLVGVTKKRWLNVGMDVNVKAVHNDPQRGSSFLKVLNFENTRRSRVALASIGPKIKLAPFKNLRFAIQSSVWIPVAEDLEADQNFVVDAAGNPVYDPKPWLDFNRYTWWNRFFYDHTFGSKVQVFGEFDLLFRYAKDSAQYANRAIKPNTLDAPASLIVSYFPTNEVTLYVLAQYNPTYTNTTLPTQAGGTRTYVKSSDFTQVGAGFKFQLSPTLQLEFLYTDFIDSFNAGAGQTFNVGFRYF